VKRENNSGVEGVKLVLGHLKSVLELTGSTSFDSLVCTF
jgi:hypothetical protein